MKTCKQLAIEWGLSERTVNDLCKKGKIDGVIKVGRMWQMREDGIQDILKFGIAFSGKKVNVKTK